MIRRTIVQVLVLLVVPASQKKRKPYWPKLLIAIIGLATVALRLYLTQ